MKIRCLIYLTILLFCFSCKRKVTLFEQIDSSHSGIHFNNKIVENDSINPLNQINIYNGGGVGIGDFNNDGLPDIYFAGSMVSNKLYSTAAPVRVFTNRRHFEMRLLFITAFFLLIFDFLEDLNIKTCNPGN